MEHILSMIGLAKKAGRVEIGEEPVGSAARSKHARVILVASDAAAGSVRRAYAFAQTGACLCLTIPADKDALGRALGLPERFLIKPPSDGLTGLTDEDNLGFSYHAVNEYIRRGVCPDEAVREKIDRMHRASRFKFQTIPVYHNGLPMALEEETDYYK